MAAVTSLTSRPKGGSVVLNTCMACNKAYKLDETNAVIFLYEDRTYMDNVHMMCAKGHSEVLFFTDAESRDDFLRNHDELTVVREHSPDEETIECYCEVFGIQLVKPVELSIRHERLIQQLGDVLTATPDDVLLELFSNPPPKSNLPRRWI